MRHMPKGIWGAKALTYVVGFLRLIHRIINHSSKKISMENQKETKASLGEQVFGKRRASMFEIVGEFFLVPVSIMSALQAESFGVLIFFIALSLGLLLKGIRDIRSRINKTI